MLGLQRVLRRTALYLITLLSLGLPFAAQAAPVCPAGIKDTVAKALHYASLRGPAEHAKAEASLYQAYKFCATDGAQTPANDPIHVAARQCGAKVVKLGSTQFEDMACCGYDPQRRTFACPVRIKQSGGFGPAPIPGSREYVLHCVQDASGAYRKVGVDSVHLANSALPPQPSWQFAVVANANENLHLVQPMNGAERKARSILSWNFEPRDCDYQPIWGNVIDYKIRLDQ